MESPIQIWHDLPDDNIDGNFNFLQPKKKWRVYIYVYNRQHIIIWFDLVQFKFNITIHGVLLLSQYVIRDLFGLCDKITEKRQRKSDKKLNSFRWYGCWNDS